MYERRSIKSAVIVYVCPTTHSGHWKRRLFELRKFIKLILLRIVCLFPHFCFMFVPHFCQLLLTRLFFAYVLEEKQLWWTLAEAGFPSIFLLSNPGFLLIVTWWLMLNKTSSHFIFIQVRSIYICSVLKIFRFMYF